MIGRGESAQGAAGGLASRRPRNWALGALGYVFLSFLGLLL